MFGKAIKVTVALGLGLVTSSAMAQSGEPIYLVHMYSDASHTEEVGYLDGVCKLAPYGGVYVQYTQHGTYTIYDVDELVGYCEEE